MKNQPDSILPEISSSLSDEEAYRLILNNLSDTFILVDRDLKVVTATGLARKKILQYFKADIQPGYHILDLVNADRKPYLLQIYNTILEGGPEQYTEAELNTDNGPVIIQSFYKAAVNHLGEIVGIIISSRDITVEKKAAENLKKAEERWRFALEGAQQGVWDWNLLTGECFYSEGYKKLYGYSHDELKNSIQEWEQLIHPDDRIKMKTAVEEHLNGPSAFHESTYRILARDGRYKWIMARGMIIERDELGKPLRMIGTHTDITEQVTAREKLAVSEKNYKNLFQGNPLPCWIYDTETLRFLEVNEAAISHYGFNREEFHASTIHLVYKPGQYDLLHQNLELRLHSTQKITGWKHCKKNGEEILVDLNTSFIEYNNRSAMLVVVNDVTVKMVIEETRIKTEEQLRKINERFHLASKATSDAIYDWDLVNHQLFWGEGVYTLFGFNPGDVGVDKWISLIHPDDHDQVFKSLNEVLEHQTKWQYNYRFADVNGNYHYALDRGFIIRDESGKAIRMIGALQDITDLKQKENELLISNERYNYATIATSDVIWDFDVMNQEVLWSDNLQRVMGWELPPDKKLDFEFCMGFIHPADRKRVETKLNYYISDPEVQYWQEEFRFRKADGTYCYVTDRGFVIRNQEKEAIRIIGAIQDISERTYYIQLLSLERQIFEMSASIHVSLQQITDTLLKGFEEINPEISTSVFLLKDGITELLSAPSLPDEYTAAFNGIKIGPAAASCGTAMFRKEPVITEDISTDQFWSDYQHIAERSGIRACFSFPVIHSSGMVLGSLGIYYKEKKSPSILELDSFERIRNILRVLMEHYWSVEEIKKANERFDIMMQATHDLIWDWNLETNMVYRDEEGLRNVYGITDNEKINHIDKWINRLHPDDRQHVHHVFNNILNSVGQNEFDVEYRFQREDGSYSHVYDRGKLIRNQEGKPIRMIGAAQDITVRKRLEQELLQNELERQKAINQATVDTQEQERSEIGKELHDNVNQVLTTTKLYLDLADSNAELKDELIRKSSRNIISVINEIRQLSRSLMDPSIGDLGLIDSIHDLIENINLTRKLHVKLTADKKIESVLDNNHRLTVFRIIQEALNNAIRHAKATMVHISIRKNKNEAEVVIEDDGKGFEPEQVKKGAGLKNIQNRIYLINGLHHITSSPGKGCKIVISFPINTNPK